MGDITDINPDFILQKKWEDTVIYIYDVILKNMNKFDRESFGKDLTHYIWEIEADIIRIAFSGSGGNPLLNKVDMNFKVLIRMLQLSSRMKIIPMNQYTNVSKYLVELGKIIGGLIRKS